ncbi:MAG: 23S rRNA (uracil(1939)-C(5))-methyltransferase RlmD [Faecalibacterium sp.]
MPEKSFCPAFFKKREKKSEKKETFMDCTLRAKNCGGCPLLELDYAQQLSQKEEKVRSLLGKFGPVHPIRGMEDPWHYRNKVISTFAPGSGGTLTSGIYAAGTHRVLPVESCLLQDKVLDKTMQAVREAASACRYQPYNEDKGTGLVRHCLLRRGVATGQVMVVLVTAQAVLPGARNFARLLLEAARHRDVTVTTIVQNINPRRTSVVLGNEEKVLYGKGFILDTLCGKTYAISPRSFYQVNPVQTAVLYGLAVEAAQLTGRETVIDAYCGIGTIGLTAADRAGQVIGVERNRDAVRDAIGNARHNGVKNARFFAADATEWIAQAAAAGQRADVILMDPPREGSTPQFLDSVAKMSPRRVVYVSCNPETMARDLEHLTHKGYRAEGFVPVDMFPHTEHVETVCALSKLDFTRGSQTI